MPDTAAAASPLVGAAIAVVLFALILRSIWRALGDAYAEAEKRRKRIARERKARKVRRLAFKSWGWFAATDLLQLVRPKGASARFAQTRANDLFDREQACRRMRLDGWAPRVVVPTPPKRRRNRSGRRGR